MKKLAVTGFLVLFTVTGFAQSGGAGKTKVGDRSQAVAKQAPPITSEQADEILTELRRIRQLLEKQDSTDTIANELKLMRQVMERQQQPQQAAAAPAPAAPPQHVKIALGETYSMGSKDAPVVMVEFSDYQCPFCRAFHSGAFPEIKKNLIDTGKVRFISRDLPLEFHNNALKAAQAARCAGEQNKFWEMRDVMITNASSLSPDAINGYAKSLGLDMTKFQACTAGDRYIKEIQAQANGASAIGIGGTPSFVVGKMNGDQLDGVVLVGAQPYSFYESQVNGLITK